MTMTYRAGVIGSLLRPAYLKEARQAWEAGSLPTPKFKRIEDRAVNEAIALGVISRKGVGNTCVPS